MGRLPGHSLKNKITRNMISFLIYSMPCKISSLRRPWSLAPRYYTGDRLKGDERILGDSEFVQSILRASAKARSLFCYWMAHELKISLSDPARKLGMAAAGVGYAVRRGEAISIEGNYQLID